MAIAANTASEAITTIGTFWGAGASWVGVTVGICAGAGGGSWISLFIGAPQFAQNFILSVTSLPQFEQNIMHFLSVEQ